MTPNFKLLNILKMNLLKFNNFIIFYYFIFSFIFIINYANIIIESEDSLKPKKSALTIGTTDDDNDQLQSRAIKPQFYHSSQCPIGSECSPLSDCTILLYEASKLCYSGDRTLYCGVNEIEPYICCPRNPLERSKVCGRSLVSGQSYNGLGAFPFVARIGFKNVNTGNIAYPCAGSIISKRIILTAAHCALATADGHRLSSVRIGEYDTANDPDCAGSGFCAPSVVNHAINHIIVHPDYVNGKYHHDIALIVLKTPLNYTVAAQPICLRTHRDDLTVNKRASIVGWGKLSQINTRLPEMQFLKVPLTAWETCLRVYGSTGALESPKSVDGQWMCAGGEGKDACQGFGGAPLVIRENGIYMQIGIMSFGSDNCGGLQIPSVYTSIAHFSQWIQDNSPVE